MRRQRVKRSSTVYRGRRYAAGVIRLALAVFLALIGWSFLLVRIWGMRFSGFLLLGIAAVLVCSVVLDRLADGGKGLWRAVRRVFYGVLTLGVSALLCVEIFVIGQGKRDMSALPADAAVVLGAGVNGNTPSLALATRLEAARKYLEQHPDIPAVLTGGRGYGENITEARCMYDWLTGHGIAADRLILEEQAADTAENFSRSKALLNTRGISPENAVIAIVTNDFHVARARVLAEKAGYGSTFGVSAPLPWRHLEINYDLREAFALMKAVIMD